MQHFKLKRHPFPAELQGKIYGATIFANGLYMILIDSTATEEKQAATLRHELAHIVLNHLEQTKPVNEINSFGDDMFGAGWIEREREADQYAAKMTDCEYQQLMQWAI